MIKSLVLVSQAYLGFASPSVLARAAEQARLSLVLNPGEEPHPRLVPHLSKIHRLAGETRRNLQPAFDADALAEIVRAEVEEFGAENVAVFCQHEDNVVPAAAARRACGVAGDGPELVNRFRDKLLMKKHLAESAPHVLPRHTRLEVGRIAEDVHGYHRDLVAELGTDTLVVKPTTGAGSLNVAIVRNADDLALVGERIGTDEREFDYEVDEYLTGTMHQCDSFVSDGKVVFSGILELGCSNFDFVQGRPLSVYPVTDKELYQALFAFNQEVTTALGFRDGSTHHEVFVRRDADGRLEMKFLEIAARVPGGLGVPFHERNSGINLIDANLRLVLGETDPVSFKTRNNVVSALLPVGHGTVTALNPPQLASPYTIDWRVKVGDVVDSRSLADNAGILLLSNDDPTALRRDFESLQHYVPVICA